MSQIKKLFGAVMLVGLVAGSGFAFSQSAALSEEMKARIAPVGTVCKAGESCAAAATPVSTGPKSGKEVYASVCTTCHSVGVAGAPKTGVADDWNPRIAKGMDVLYTNAINGINGMPAKGLCMTCSDDEIKAAVDHMIAPK